MPRRCARPPVAAAGVRGATTRDLRINSHPAGFSGGGGRYRHSAPRGRLRRVRNVRGAVLALKRSHGGVMRLPHTRSTALWAAAGAGAALGGYAVLAANAWRNYGHPIPSAADEKDDLLDRFIPDYDVVERHHVRVEAPAAVTLAAAKE